MNSPSANSRMRCTVNFPFDAATGFPSRRTLERADVERMMKTAVQSGSAGQVPGLDAALLVGCVDWYLYASPGTEQRAT